MSKNILILVGAGISVSANIPVYWRGCFNSEHCSFSKPTCPLYFRTLGAQMDGIVHYQTANYSRKESIFLMNTTLFKMMNRLLHFYEEWL